MIQETHARRSREELEVRKKLHARLADARPSNKIHIISVDIIVPVVPVIDAGNENRWILDKYLGFRLATASMNMHGNDICSASDRPHCPHMIHAYL